MKHLAKIQAEFIKEAAKWEELSYDAQKEYMQKHPKTKKKLTAKPGQEGAPLSELKEKAVKKKLETKKDQLSPKSDEFDKRIVSAANNIFWDADQEYGALPVGSQLSEIANIVFPDKSFDEIKNLSDDDYVKAWKEEQTRNWLNDEYEGGTKDIIDEYIDMNDINMSREDFTKKLIDSKANRENILKDRDECLKNELGE